MKIICALLLLTINVETLNILAVFPTPSFSHQMAFQPFILELVKKGHQLVVITPIPLFERGEAPENLREIDVRNACVLWEKDHPPSTGTMVKTDLYTELERFLDISIGIFVKQLQNDEVKDIMEDKNAFDLVIVEAWSRSFLGIAHKFNATIMKFSSLGAVYDEYNIMGATNHPIYYPSVFTYKIEDLTVWDKIAELFHRYCLYDMHSSHEAVENELLRKELGGDMPSLGELGDRVELMLMNVHREWELHRPLPPSVVTAGSLNIRTAKELPKDLQSYLDSAVNGVIYVSFGSNAMTEYLPPDQMKAMISALSRTPYKVLWKWDQEELPGRTDNIRISKWFPQQDVLKHRNLKLFVTQGGLQSIDEAVDAGVPMLGIPSATDQYYNVENILRLKIGLKLPLQSFTEQEFEQAVRRLIHDGSFRQNLRNLRAVLSDLPQPAMQRAVWWTEHAARHGARHLRSPAHNMRWTQYLEVELVAIAAASSAAVLLLFGVVMYYCTRIVWASLMCFRLCKKRKSH